MRLRCCELFFPWLTAIEFAFGARLAHAIRTSGFKEHGCEFTKYFVHLDCELTDLPLGSVATTKSEKMKQLARVHRHDQLCFGGIGEQESGVFGGNPGVE